MDSARAAGKNAAQPPSSAAGLLALQRTIGNRALATSLQRQAQDRQRLRPLPGGEQTGPLPDAPLRGASLLAVDVPSSLASVSPAFAAMGGAQVEQQVSTSALSNGRSLSEAERAPFEQSFGFDLSPVRVHEGGAANAAASALGAHAFTVGDHVVLGEGVGTGAIQREHVLGHELAHVVQHRLAGDAQQARVGESNSPAELEASAASERANRGERQRIGSASSTVDKVPVPLILAGIGLLAGIIIAATSDSPEENREKHQRTGSNPADEIYAWIPVYGSIQNIRHAESELQRVLGVGFLALDLATVGAMGTAGKALIRVGSAAVRMALREQGTRLLAQGAAREGGELVLSAGGRELAEQFANGGGKVIAREAAETEIRQALERGAMVAVGEGGLNHAALYVRNAAGQIVRIHGGPLRLVFHEAAHEAGKSASRVATQGNAYVIIEGGAMTAEQILERVGSGMPAVARWITGNPTSCGILQGAAMEASGLSATALAKLVPSGAAARLIPITMMEHWAGSGAGMRIIEGGIGRLIGGSLMSGAVLGGATSMLAPATAALRITLNDAASPLPEEPPATEPTPQIDPRDRTPQSDEAARRIIGRWGREPSTDTMLEIREELPYLFPGFYVMRAPELSLAASLSAAGMRPETARAIFNANASRAPAR